MYCQPTNKTEAGVAQQEKMKNINVLKCLYVDAMSMENKQQALEEILNNEVYELVGTAEARWADSCQYFECQQRRKQSASRGSGAVAGCSCVCSLVRYMQWAQMMFCFLEGAYNWWIRRNNEHDKSSAAFFVHEL